MKQFMILLPCLLACSATQVVFSPLPVQSYQLQLTAPQVLTRTVLPVTAQQLVGARTIVTAPHIIASAPQVISAAPQVVDARTVLAPQLVAAAPQVVAAAPQIISVPTASQYRVQDELGQFAFGHQGDNQAREEVKTVDGSVRGAYQYVDPNGKLINVQYLADDNGFRVVGANNLPEAPAIPAPIELVGPAPVQDTPEVVAARADFQKKFAEAKSAAEGAPEDPAPAAAPAEAAAAPAEAAAAPAEAAAAPAEENSAVTVEAKSRKRRQILLGSSPLIHAFSTRSLIASPFIAPAPIIAPLKTTIKTQELKPVEDAPTPAATKKAEITEKEQEVISPLGSWILPATRTIIAPTPIITHLKTTVKTQELTPDNDAPTPANTKKAEITEKEHEVISPLGSWILPSTRTIVLTEEEKKAAAAAVPIALSAISPISPFIF